MINKLILSIICTCYLFATYAQQQEIDSLQRVIKTTTVPSDKAYIHNRLAWLLILSDTEEASAHLDSAQTIYTESNDSTGLAFTDYKRATLLRFNGENREALSSINKYINFFTKNQDTLRLVNGYYQKGVILSQMGDYQSSNSEYYIAIDLFGKLKDKKSVGMVHNSLGINYKNLEDYDKAFDHYQEALEIQIENQDDENIANTYGNLSVLFAVKKDYNQAFDYLDKALIIDVKTNNQWGIASNTLNRGIFNMEKGDPNKAIPYFNKALEIQQKNDYNEQEQVLCSLGKAYVQLGEYKKGELYLNRALSLNPSKKILMDIYENLSILFQKKGNNKEALFMFKKYVTSKDSIFNIEKSKDINKLRYQFETKQKNNKIVAQELLLSKKENQLLKKKSQIYYTILLASLLVLSLLAFLFYQRQKNKLKTKEIEVLKDKEEIHRLESFIEGEEKERSRIAQDLHDGINGDLSVIKYKITSLENNHLNDQDAEEYSIAIQMLDNAIDQVRKISHDLTPPSLHNFSLIEAVDNYCQRVKDHQSIKMTFQHFGVSVPLAKEEETAIYRVIQELINNVIKHAKATGIMVQINCHEENIHISIEDDGVGFDVNKSYAGIGLKNIDARIKLLKADLLVESDKNGTLTTVNIDRKNLV